MSVDLVFGWPQIVVLIAVLISFGSSCIRASKQKDHQFVIGLVGFLWFLGTIYTLYAGGFFSPR